MSFTSAELSALPHVISAPRFATYLRAKSNNSAQALELYVWNLQVSSAFIVPLQLFEVATRNGVVEVLERVHGGNWPWSNGFIRSLPQKNQAKPLQYDPRSNLQSLSRYHPTAGKIVAELNFAFWERIFTAGQDTRLWNPHFRSAFPDAPSSKTVSQLRGDMYSDLISVRKFRNRIAHHEPIFTRNLSRDLKVIRKVLGYRSKSADAWLGKVETVSHLLQNRP